MELKTYLRILLKNWWVILSAFLVTLTATIVLTFNQTPVYSSTATFVVGPSAVFEDTRSFVSGLDTLSRRTEIATTYSEVASSRAIKKAALDRLNLSTKQRQGLSASGQLVAGTNILKITVEARDPLIAKEAANAVGAETMEYVKSLYEPYVLRPLDEATVRNQPVRPSKQMNLILGGTFGLVLGAGLAFLVEYLRTPIETIAATHFVDTDTGIYNKGYFQQRLGAELARAKRQRYPLSIVLLDVDQSGTLDTVRSHHEQSEVLRKTALVLRQYLREEDLIAYFGDATFGLLLPDMPGDAAKALIEQLQMRVSWTPFELERSGLKINLSSVAGVATFDHNSMEQEELLSRAAKALHRAGTNGYGQTYLATEESINEHDKQA